MGVEACRYDDKFGRKGLEARQDPPFHGRSKGRPTVACAERRVDDGAGRSGLALGARAGIKRHFMRGGIHHAGVVPEDGLRAVAVMDVEIDNGDAPDTVGLLGVAGGNGHIVEQTKAHGPRRLGWLLLPGR